MDDQQQSEPGDGKENIQRRLSDIEARVLGTLMEKQLATPDAYPLTLNSLVVACNQKTSREPVTNYTEGEVQRCLDLLRERKLIEVEYGSRANRFMQRLSRELHLEKQGQALLALLLLRGPQTLNELFSRSQRLVSFNSEKEVGELLDLLCIKTNPIVRLLPRQSGQREQRYGHLLCGEPSYTAPDANTVSSKGRPGDLEMKDLAARVARLEQQMKQLMALNGIVDEEGDV